jgi:hypothetical protein
MSKKIKIKKDERFGMLRVICELPTIKLPCGQPNRIFLCKCDCGNDVNVRLSNLKHRNKSCGCVRGESHNESNTKLHKLWASIKNRTSKNYNESHLYFYRNIFVCDEWKNSYLKFKKWCTENGYKHGLQIDRINNDDGYHPNNCRFVENHINVNNRRNTMFVNYNNVKYPFMELMREKDLLKENQTIKSRINRGWDIEKAIDTPIRDGNYFRGKRIK